MPAGEGTLVHQPLFQERLQPLVTLAAVLAVVEIKHPKFEKKTRDGCRAVNGHP